MKKLLQSGIGMMIFISIMLAGSLLAVAQNQPVFDRQKTGETEKYEAQLNVPGFYHTNNYLYPTAPKYYQCCTPMPELVIEGQSDSDRSVKDQRSGQKKSNSKITTKDNNPHIIARGVEPSCVNLSELSQLEILMRSKRPSLQNCGPNFVVYDHFPCSCRTFCGDATWHCNCPGVIPGQLPQINPQDSVRSQVEQIGNTICTPCNSASVCP